MILAGIDEAGLGPVLGPLVVSVSAFRMDDGGCTAAGEAAPVAAAASANPAAPTSSATAEAVSPGSPDPPNFWKLLNPAVGKKPSRKRPTRIPVGDSKALFNRQKSAGLAPLERGVLTHCALLGGQDGWPVFGEGLSLSLAGLLGSLSPSAVAAAGEYPWYGGCDLPLPRHVTPTDVALSSNALRVAMRRAGLSPLGLRAEVIFAGEFNRLVSATNNKARMSFDVLSRLLAWLWELPGGEDMHITVDRQGGRTHYREALQRLWPGCRLKVLEETDRRSAYVIEHEGRRLSMEFRVEAERACYLAALASMTSKYVRELFMELLNGYWAGHVEGLAPTAGYYSDGRRFFAEIEPAMAALNVVKDRIYRCR